MKAVRVTLMAHPLTVGQREGAFPLADEPLDGGRPSLARPPSTRVLRGPETRCDLLPDAETAPDLRDLDMGTWRGKRLAEIDPVGLARWVGDLDAAPHGGESVTALIDRVRGWLGGLHDGPVLGLTHPAVVRAAVSVATGADYQRVDVPPLGRALLTGVGGRWNLRLQ